MMDKVVNKGGWKNCPKTFKDYMLEEWRRDLFWHIKYGEATSANVRLWLLIAIRHCKFWAGARETPR